MTPYYEIKNDDISLFKHAMREVCIILQVYTLSKPKYIKIVLR